MVVVFPPLNSFWAFSKEQQFGLSENEMHDESTTMLPDIWQLRTIPSFKLGFRLPAGNICFWSRQYQSDQISLAVQSGETSEWSHPRMVKDLALLVS
ncbi:hypothetical protein MKZ38_006168 [Zalerion maritima]|uniref:Uncharacterized protein n=1 Tax=Zalerion maritima TaxID=339359 RepID=A0AAD5RJ63_9PEZI|nr:hypothetical protein MKZ38_006168 [Zalerion maritima]